MSKNYSILGQTNSGKASLLDFNDIKNFDPLFFGISPDTSSYIDPQERISLLATYEALEDSYLDPIELRGSNTSVFMGTYSMDYMALQYNDTHGVNSAIRCIANRISYCFDFRGQSISMYTACSASSNSIISGCKTLIDGTSNISVCGGANIILDSFFWKSISFDSMDSKSGYSHSFNSFADGFGRGEGCAVVILKRMVDAISDGNKIYCTIKGFSSNIDGNFGKQSFFAPSINGQNTNIKLAFKSTNGTILPSDIYYVETHGTGTPVGDPIELESISKAFDTPTSRSSTSPLYIGSIKSNIGHSEAASGVVSLIKCALMFKHRILTPNYNFKQGNPRINFKDWNLKVVTEIQEFPKQNKPISMMINNFGATGSNCCFILSEYINNNNMERNNNVDKDIEYLIPFSANSKKSLDTYKRLIVENYLGTMEFNEFFVKQVFTKTTKLGQRSVIVSKPDWSGFNNLDNHYSTISNTPSNITRSIEPTIVFIFPGQGSQFNRMGIELYEKSKLFRDSMNEINELFKPLYGYSILDKLRSIDDNDKNEIHLPSIVHPSMVMIQISLFKLLKNHWNINPSFIVGHSFGEFAAAYCSGMIDLETCTKVVYARSKLQDKLVGSGKMLSISGDNFNCNYSSQYPNVEISCYNSNNSIVVSGSEQDLTKLKPYWYESKEGYKNRIEGPPITIYGNSNDLTSPLISKTTFIDISKEPSKWLKGHVVKDVILFPGAGYIDIILNILKHQDTIFIDHLEFKLPFILSSGKNLELTTNITPSESDKRNAYFHIKDQKSNEWVCSSSGIISIDQTKNENNQDTGMMDIENEIIYDIETIKSQNNFTHLLKDDLYNHINRIASIAYNDCFKRVEECWIGDNTSLIKVSTSKLISNNDNQMFLNASIIDCCFHGLLVLLKDQCSLVFEKFEGFKLNCSNLPLKVSSSLENNINESFIYVLAKQTDSYSNSFAGSIVAFLENGKVLFEVNKIVTTSTTPIIDSTVVEYPNNEIYSYYNESKDSLISGITSFKGIKTIFEINHQVSIIEEENDDDQNINNLVLVSDFVSNSIKPILQERMVFRIFELNNGNNLTMSKHILQSIDHILNHNQQQNSNILIEYSISNTSNCIISTIEQNELLKIISNNIDLENLNISILFKTIDLGNHFSSQSYIPSHYDIITFENVLNSSKNIEFNIDQFHCLLKSNGHLLFTETQIHSNFSNNLLQTISNHNGFINTISKYSMANVDTSFIIHTKKQPLLSTVTKSNSITSYNIIFYSSIFKQTSSSINSFIDSITSNGLFKNSNDNNYTIISSFDQFKNQNISDSEKSIIFFLPAIEPLSSDNFNEISYELFKVYQLLMKTN